MDKVRCDFRWMMAARTKGDGVTAYGFGQLLGVLILVAIGFFATRDVLRKRSDRNDAE